MLVIEKVTEAFPLLSHTGGNASSKALSATKHVFLLLKYMHFSGGGGRRKRDAFSRVVLTPKQQVLLPFDNC